MSEETSQSTISQRRKRKDKLQKSVAFVKSQRTDTGLHFSIIKCGEDILDSIKLNPCAGCEFGCGKPGRKKNAAERYHCPLCTTSIFKPAVYCKTKKHLLNHFQGRGGIILRGFKITGCHLKCVNYSQTNQQRSHFHCPFCSDTFANKSFLIKHGHHCRLNIQLQQKQDLFQTENMNDEEIVDSTKMTKDFSNEETAHPLSRENENKCTNMALKIKSENNEAPKKHFKFRKLLYPNINVTISATSQNSSGRNEKDRRVYPPVECTQCRQLYHPKYIYEHIRMQHDTVKSKPNISQSRHHHSVCIDSRLCLYTSSKTISGIQIPLHVIKMSNVFDNKSLITVEDLNKRFKCESTMCMNKCRSEWASGNIKYLCDHLKSVDFSVEPGNGSLDEKYHWLDKEKLTTRVFHGQLSENCYKKVLCLNSNAINKNTPMIVELPQAFKSYHKKKRGHRFTFYSVYAGHVSKWSKFERTVVTIDHLKRAIHCHCRENACVHRGSVICWLNQNEKLEVQLSEVKYKEKNKGIRQRNKLRIPRIENEMSIRIARDNTKVKIKVAKKTHKELSLKTIYVVDKDSKNLVIPSESTDFMSEDKNLKISGSTLPNHDYVDKSNLYENVDNLNESNSTLKYSLSNGIFTNKHNVIKYSDFSQEKQILPIVSKNVKENTDLITSHSPINIVTNKVRKVFKVINIVKDDDSLFRAVVENLEYYTQEDYLELKNLVLQWLADCDHSLYKINPQSVNIPSQGLLKQETSNVQSVGHMINPSQASTDLTPISVSQPINHTISSSQNICILQIPKETKEKQLYNLIDQSIRQKVSLSQTFQKQSYQPNNNEFTLSNELSSFQLATYNEKHYMIAVSNIFCVTIKVYNNNGGCSDHIDTYMPIEGISEETLHFKRDGIGHYDALTQTDVPDELYTVV